MKAAEMETASIVIEHEFDSEMLEQINAIRAIRYDSAVKMLDDLDNTAAELEKRGFLGDGPSLDMDELREELTNKVSFLRQRVDNPKIVYADEISLYVDMME